MSGSLEYQFEVDLRKGINHPYKITLKTERMPYYDALDLAEQLGRKGIHYNIIEFDLRCNNPRQITSRILRMPKRSLG